MPMPGTRAPPSWRLSPASCRRFFGSMASSVKSPSSPEEDSAGWRRSPKKKRQHRLKTAPFRSRCRRPRIGQFLRHPSDERLVVNRRQSRQKHLIRKPAVLHRRNFQQKVEVIAHQAVRNHPAPGEFLLYPHHRAEFLLLLRPNHKPSLHHSRDNVVKNRLLRRFPPPSQPSRTSAHDL